MYGCSSSVSWNPIAYIPVVNEAAMVAMSQHVSSQLTVIKSFELLDRPTFMAEDIAFFNGKLCCNGTAVVTWHLCSILDLASSWHCLGYLFLAIFVAESPEPI